MDIKTPLLLRQDFMGGLAVIAVAAAAFWLVRDLPGGNGGGIGPGTLPLALQKLVESEVARWTPILKSAQQQAAQQ